MEKQKNEKSFSLNAKKANENVDWSSIFRSSEPIEVT